MNQSASGMNGAAIPGDLDALESKQLQLLTLYEQRINRSLQKNLAPAAIPPDHA
jgi:hypothetical protein